MPKFRSTEEIEAEKTQFGGWRVKRDGVEDYQPHADRGDGLAPKGFEPVECEDCHGGGVVGDGEAPGCPACGHPGPTQRPTIEELDAILNSEDDSVIYILPDGSITARTESNRPMPDEWCVFDPAGFALVETVRSTEQAAKETACKATEMFWTDLEAEGYAVRPVRVQRTDHKE